MKTEIYLGKVQVNSVQGNAGLFYGDNTIKGWQTRTKTNYTLGRLSGDGNTVASRFDFINDPDIIDILVKTFKTTPYPMG